MNVKAHQFFTLLRSHFIRTALMLVTFVWSVSLHAGDSVYQRALSAPDRLASDVKYDDMRKSTKILPFTHLQPADKVLELGAGGGYTTELISRVVGDNGNIYVHRLYNEQRIANNRLPNVVKLRDHSLLEMKTVLKENNVADEKLDAIVIFFIIHDIWLNNEMDKSVMQAMFDALKPGGHIIVLDNAAKPDSGLKYTESLHRIDENFVIKELEKAGFVLEETSDVLRNSKDDHTKPWGDFKGHQDRFAFRFVKPEK